jgi:hypothetical protein
MINPQWGFNPIIIRMLFTVTLFQHNRRILDVGIIPMRDIISSVSIVEIMYMRQRLVGSHGRRSKISKKKKVNLLNPLNLLFIIVVLA